MGKIKDFIAKGILSGMLLAASLPVHAQSDDRIVEILDGVLSGMAVDGTLDYIAKAYASTSKKSSLTPPYLPDYPSSTSIAGQMVLPVEGYVTSKFGYRPSFGRMHKGIDLHLQVGDTVRAALDGVVSRVSVDPHGYGLFVVIRHAGDLETRYGHLSSSLVASGKRVAAGDAIALGGNSGNSTGPHLHFETRQGGVAFDPSLMFNFTHAPTFAATRSLARLDAENPSTDVLELVSLVTSATPVSQRRQSSTQTKSRYVVKTGDTVASVAANAGISTLTLCRLNMLSSTDALKPGTMLRLR